MFKYKGIIIWIIIILFGTSIFFGVKYTKTSDIVENLYMKCGENIVVNLFDINNVFEYNDLKNEELSNEDKMAILHYLNEAEMNIVNLRIIGKNQRLHVIGNILKAERTLIKYVDTSTDSGKQKVIDLRKEIEFMFETWFNIAGDGKRFTSKELDDVIETLISYPDWSDPVKEELHPYYNSEQ